MRIYLYNLQLILSEYTAVTDCDPGVMVMSLILEWLRATFQASMARVRLPQREYGHFVIFFHVQNQKRLLEKKVMCPECPKQI